MKRLPLFAILIVLVASCIIPQIARASSCYCSGIYQGPITEMSAPDPVAQDFCITKTGQTTITSPADCVTAAANYNSEPDTYKNYTCAYSDSASCTTPIICNGAVCSRSLLDCQTLGDCNKYGQNSICIYEGTSIGLGSEFRTTPGKCYFDQDAMRTYMQTPSLTSITGAKTDLQKPSTSIRIPGLNFTDVQNTLDSNNNIHLPWIGEYIAAIYKYMLGITSIVAVFMIVISGARIVVSAGGEGQAAAYHRIGQVIVGLVILWGSYFILNTINPDLTQFKALQLKYVQPVPIPEIDVIDEPVASESPETGAGNVPMFKQFDAQWGNTVYGSDPSCTTIAKAGCGPTSLAMVLSSYNTYTTPDKTAAFMGQPGNGRVCNQGTSMDLTIDNLNNSPWSTFTGDNVPKSKAMTLLQSGHPIIFLCHDCTGKGQKDPKHYGGHFMVLTSVDAQGTVTVNDPGANDSKAIQTMTSDQLNNTGGFWYVRPK